MKVILLNLETNFYPGICFCLRRIEKLSLELRTKLQFETHSCDPDVFSPLHRIRFQTKIKENLNEADVEGDWSNTDTYSYFGSLIIFQEIMFIYRVIRLEKSVFYFQISVFQACAVATKLSTDSCKAGPSVPLLKSC